MSTIDLLRKKVKQLPYSVLSVLAAISSFGAYTSMYAFRKAFAAGTFTGQQYFHVDYKVWLVIAQIIGYTLSKFYGIRFIAEIKSNQRGLAIIVLVSIAWLALLGFALVPAPFNIIFMFINGFPLGLIWGLVFGYLEGRRSTEFMAAVLSISLIFASGFVKTVGRTLLHVLPINDFQMPFITGAIFALPLALFVFVLELMPPPTQEDITLRAKRVPMTADERAAFLKRFLPGIILTLIIYVLLTVMRDVRDNFEVEIWASLGIKNNMIFTSTDSQISVVVLVAISLLILVRNNLKAFGIIHLLIIGGCIMIGISTLLFSFGMISPVIWMTLAGLGLYLGYIPYNAIFFERLIATFRCKGNVGFLIYVADSLGYLGSVALLFVKEMGRPNISWAVFFKEGVVFVAVIGGTCALLSLTYFMKKATADKKQLLFN
jgi:MFS family permease